MKESKKRNPAVKLYGLQWGAPGWINPGKNNIHSKENIDYLIKWVQHAKSDHGLDIDYLGDWNERPWSASWHVEFRKGLNAAGLSKIKVLLDDSFKWKAGPELKKTCIRGLDRHYRCALSRARRRPLEQFQA